MEGFPGSSAGKESTCNAGDSGAISGLGGSTGEEIGYPLQLFLGFPGASAGKESACNVGDLDLIPGLGRLPGEGKGYPLQYSGLESSMDYIVHAVAKSRTRLSNFFTFKKSLVSKPHNVPMEKICRFIGLVVKSFQGSPNQPGHTHPLSSGIGIFTGHLYVQGCPPSLSCL